MEAYGEEVDLSGISVVPLGGRYVNHFWRLLSELDIPYITLLDLDREREGGGWGRIKYVIKQLIKNGVARKDILNVEGGTILSDDELEEMHSWDTEEVDIMEGWIDLLENYNVYFSSPLDIDFLMLECLGEKYKGLLKSNEGPRLCIEKNGKNEKINIQNADLDKYRDAYMNHIDSDVRRTLKKEGGEGNTYNDEQKELMLWYTYFFLNRGKPTTHIAVLSTMTDEDLKINTPDVIKKIVEKAKKILNN